VAFFLVSFVSFVDHSLRAAEPSATWSTYRGNPQRTGNVDGQPGPGVPRVLWTFKSQEHFIASPVVASGRVYISGLGGLNAGTFYCLSDDPKTAERIVWTKMVPYLKLPTVSSPALADGKLIFGDGMHQTDGALLHCLRSDTGGMLWQLPQPGKLVHMEGSATVAQKRVFIGGGSAGVLCVDLDRLTLDGKEHDLAAIQALLDKKWKELQAKYEVEKKKDPCFAVPPNEDMLPKPTPRRVWQQGEQKWHVDAPLTVVGDRVLVASAFLDKEKLGDRALYCLDAAKGDIQWRTPLKLNPWGGPSVVGDLVVVGGSTIGYDPRLLKGAKGEIAAYNLADGKEKWHKSVPGGVVSCVALTKDLAIATATDGKVRAFELTNGERRWIYDAKTPFFAPAAVAGGVAYAGDLKGVIHAIDLATGQARWTLDLGTQPDVKAPGMVYGGPVVQGGRLYVATCNLEGPFARQPTAVVCVGDK
jgi:outer membrane protein assembly factor BamB